MSKYYSGMDGKLSYAEGVGTPVQVAKVRDWQIQLQTDALETTTLEKKNRCYTTGLMSATGSATILYYDDAPVALIQQVLQSGAPPMGPTCKLKLGWGANYFEFNAVITSASMGATVGDVMSVQIQFTKSDAFTGTNLSGAEL